MNSINTDNILKLFQSEIKVINLGIPSFAEDLTAQNLKVVKVDWKPPAGGSEKMIKLMDRIKSKNIL